MKKVLAITLSVSVFLLSGCGQVGTAAKVGGTKISQASVQASIDAVIAERINVDTSQMQIESGEALNRSQLRLYLLGALFREIGSELKITISKAEIDTRRAGIIDQIGGAEQLPLALVGAGIAAKDFDSYIEFILFSDKIGQTLVAAGVAQDQVGLEIQKIVIAKAKEIGVTINPRYGAWDPETADVVASDAAKSAVTPSNN